MARRFDSCRQCVRRRIKCDAQAPQCSKCLRKGIDCSGVGQRFRFVAGNTGHNYIDRQALTIRSVGLLTDPINLEHLNQSGPNLAHSDPGSMNGLRLLHSLEPLSSDSRELFDYFSKYIAPAMVVIDEELANGYRNIILPLATHDDLVRRAVSVIAMLHSASKQPNVLPRAEIERTTIIRQLQYNATQNSLDAIFNISTWTTIILLLVGETVTGHQEFVQLFTMLQNFLNHPRSFDIVKHHEPIRQFLQQQSYMFALFTPPFLGPNIGSTALQDLIPYHLDWIPEIPSGPQVTVDISHALKHSIALSRDLYMLQARDRASNVVIEDMVEQLVSILAPICETMPGMHAFVWCYFIGGASTDNPQYRAFFSERLGQVYKATGMRNITATIDMLEQIWATSSTQNWTHSNIALQRTLVM